MGLKQMVERSFSLLRASLRSVRQRFFSLLSPSSDELVPSGPQRLLGPWEQGWALDLHSRLLSGETLKEVTRVLKRAGARSVKVLALARTRYYERTALGSPQ
jgi:hypothetical protein